MADRLERSAALTGITAVALWVVGLIVLEQIADQPGTDTTPALALSYFKGENNAILAGTFFFMLGAVFFLWFLGALRARLYVAEGGTRRVTGVAFAGGVVAAASLLFMGSTQRPGRSTEPTSLRKRRRYTAGSATRSSTRPSPPRASSSSRRDWSWFGHAPCPSGSAGSALSSACGC
jgi:hypothetical protein